MPDYEDLDDKDVFGVRIEAYELKHDVPGVKRGTVFIHDPEDSELGSPAHGCMKLAWDNGSCQDWCGHTIIFPGQLAEDRKWFKPISNPLITNNRTQRLNKQRYH